MEEELVKRLFSSRRLVKVYIEECDWDRLVSRAGGIGMVSAWIRELIVRYLDSR
jgi:hypothetical protein